MTRAAKKSAGSAGRSGDPFLPGSEERVASADLQASLKSMAANAGVNLLAIRGLQGGRSQPLHMVAVSVELEGPLKAIRDMILAIENQTPLLFVSTASFRSLADGEDGAIRAELRVQGAIRGGSQPGGKRAGHGWPTNWSRFEPGGADAMTSLAQMVQLRLSGMAEFAAAIRGLPACRHARPDRSARPKRTGGAAAGDAGSHRWGLRPGSRWSAR